MLQLQSALGDDGQIQEADDHQSRCVEYSCLGWTTLDIVFNLVNQNSTHHLGCLSVRVRLYVSNLDIA